MLARLGCNPIEGMAKIALGKVPCDVCRGKKKAKFARDEKTGRWRHDPLNGTEMGCLSCSASGVANVPLRMKADMFAELAGYVYPKRKAIEIEDAAQRGTCTLEELLSAYRGVESSVN